MRTTQRFRRDFIWRFGFLKLAAGVSLFLLLFSLTHLILPATGGAREWPTKPINLIVPWAPGGSTDLAARALAPKLSKILGVPVSVINKPGGSGIIGTLEAVKSPPDGYTLLADCGGTSSIQEAWVEKLPYKVEERTYIARAMYTPEGLIVPASAPWKTVEDLANAIRSNPTAIRWTLVGGTGVPDVCTAQFRAALTAKRVDISKTLMVTFKGTGEVLIALAGGHVDIGFCSPSTANALIGAGKIRALAIAGAERYKGWPNIPSTSEAGFPSVNQVFWAGLSGPPNLPANIAKTISDAVHDVVRDPDVIDKFDAIGFVPAYQHEAIFKKFVMDEAKTIKALNLK
jgi:tripartite-type tricarboxylate transporter receptor subunit TctC